ncbi:MAG: Ldh family oxidoreductase [Chloroflexota bacterium]
MEDTGRRFAAEALATFAAAVLEGAGVPRGNAEIVVDAMVAANLRGVDTHGITRLPIFVERLRSGLVDGNSAGTVVSEGDSSAVYDGQNGLGPVVSTRAMELAIRKAEHGVGFVAVRNSNFYGTAAYYAMMALPRDMIGVSMTNCPPIMAAWGSRRGFLGTNPLAIAAPAGEERPFVLDMATSVIAKGAIHLAAKRGESIPLSWALDKEGEPTTDPKAAIEGVVLPLGGHKGFGLAMAIDILSGILSGGLFGPHIAELYNNPTTPQGVGHFFGAIRIDRFRPVAEFKADMDAMIREVKAQPLAKGVSKIMVAGEREHDTERERRKLGIPLSDTVVRELIAVGAGVGVGFEL